MVVDLGEHAGDVDFGFIKGANGPDACKSGTELFEHGRFGAGFETLGFTCAGHVQPGNLNADAEEQERYNDDIGGHEETKMMMC